MTVGESIDVPAGSVTTASSGAPSPPVPLKWWAIRWLVIHASLPGTENFCLRALVAEPAEAMPMSVSTSQNTTTLRLCASTQCVKRVIVPAEPASEVVEGGCVWPVRGESGITASPVFRTQNDSEQNNLYHNYFRCVMISL